MPDFSKRGTAPELMDVEAVSFEEFRTVLQQLVQVNGLFFPYMPTLSFLNRLHKSGKLDLGRPISIVDIGSGYGDALRRIDRWAQARGIAVDLQGVDMNPWSARAASEVTPLGRPIRWISQDLFDYKPDGGIDVVISSLFTHHLPDPLLARFVTWMENTARVGWFVNDLQRHPLPYYALKAGFFLTRRHRFIQHDGPVSVANAFKRDDWMRAIEAAGLPPDTATIKSWIPFRLCVARVKDAAP
jgi:SAM-dependent methyltransferase